MYTYWRFYITSLLSTNQLFVCFCFVIQKSSPDVSVLIHDRDLDKHTEYKTHIKTPWAAKKSEPFEFDPQNPDETDSKIEITSINDMRCNFDFEVLISYAVIGGKPCLI